MSAVLRTFSPSSKCIPSSFINPLPPPPPPPNMATPEGKPTTTTTTTAAEEEEEAEEHKDKNKNGEEQEEEKMCRKFSSTASVCSNDNEEHGEGEEDETSADEEEEAKLRAERELELGPQFTLKEQLEKDKDDESLRRWKEQLLGSVDFSSVGETLEPEVQILSLTILSPNRPELILPIPFVHNAKGFAFSLKDGSRYRLKFSFVVSNNIVSGLKYTNTVWKTGVRVENTKVMLGTFSPQQEPYTYELEEETTPSGIFARGSYSAKTKFVDDDGKCYLDISYCFEIRKDWPSPS